MGKIRYGILALFTLSILASFVSPMNDKTAVKGVVLSEKNGKPLPRVLVYITQGEEEALTNERGEFVVETARKTPFTITAEHWEYNKRTLSITDAGKRVTIRLAPKNN